MPRLKAKIQGQWVDVGGPEGPPGPQGIPGPPGVVSIIIGEFGDLVTPASLPPDGLIPVDWDGPNNPSVAYQMNIGESLYYDKPTDPLDGHLFQYIGTAIEPTGWLDIGLIQGPQGITGPPGPIGPEGPIGPPGVDGAGLDEMVVGPDDPTLTVPTADVWYDTDEVDLPSVSIPSGGLTDQALVKLSDVDGEVGWKGPYLPLTGAIMTGTIDNRGNPGHYIKQIFVNNAFTVAYEIKRYGQTPTLVQLRGLCTNDISGRLDCYVNCGGYADNWAFATTTGSTPGLDVNGTVSAADALDRSAMVTKRNVADLDPAVVSHLIDALKPITYERILDTTVKPGSEGIVPLPPFLRVGFAVEDIEECGTPLCDALVRHINYDTQTGQPTDPDQRGYSVPGLLAVALSEIKQLRARVAQLEGK